MLRLTLAALYPLAMAQRWHWPAVLILAAGLTDIVDGYIARRYGAASWIGGLLDAVADKGFALAVLVTFVVQDYLEPWQVVLLLGRDGVVVIIGTYAALKQSWIAFRRMPSRVMGKITTAAMFVLFIELVIWPDVLFLKNIFFGVAMLCSIIAATDYFICFVRAHLQQVSVT